MNMENRGRVRKCQVVTCPKTGHPRSLKSRKEDVRCGGGFLTFR